MSSFYGLIEGNRGAATRGGSKNSGFRASAQSYDGSVIVTLRYKDNEAKPENLRVRIGTNDGSSCSSDWNSQDWSGSFEEFKEALNLLHDIKEGKASVTYHRAKSNKQLALERAFKPVPTKG